jgi:hypothetical protein
VKHPNPKEPNINLPEIVINNKNFTNPVHFLLDTGAAISLIHKSHISKFAKICLDRRTAKSYSGHNINIIGYVKCYPFDHINKKLKIWIVENDDFVTRGILGMDILKQVTTIIDLSKPHVSIGEVEYPLLQRKVEKKELNFIHRLNTIQPTYKVLSRYGPL